MTDLARIAYDAVRPDYPEDCVRARLAPRPEVTVGWLRTESEIEFLISDYLTDAPEEIIEDLIRFTHRRIRGDVEAKFGRKTADWLLSDEFRDVAVLVWLDRHDAGDAIPGHRGFFVHWYSGDKAVSSALMRAILIPEAWRDEDSDEIMMRIMVEETKIRIGRNKFAEDVRADCCRCKPKYQTI